MTRMISKLLAAAMLTAAWANADTAPQPNVQKLVQVRHVQMSDPGLSQLMATLGVGASGPIAGYIALVGPKEAVAAAEEVLVKMDAQKPPPDVEVTGWLVAVSRPENSLQPLPPALESVAKQLNASFGFSDLRLLTSFVLRTHGDNRGSTNGEVSSVLGGKPVSIAYNFMFRRAELIADTPGTQTYRLRDLHLQVHLAVPAGFVAEISTDVDLREGQKVVIGKTSIASGQEMPLMLVLSAHAVGE